MEDPNLSYGEYDGQLLDITEPQIVQIQVDNHTVWINVNGLCRLRASRVSVIQIDDHITNHSRK